MKQQLCSFLLKCLGWKSIGTPIPTPQGIIIGAPHTSIWDFIVAWLFYAGVGGKASILVKKELFVWPIRRFLRRMGAIPVDRSKAASLVKQVIDAFNKYETLHLAIALEGTRKPTTKWKGGFHTIAKAARVPVYFGYFDWGKREVGRAEEFILYDDQQDDIKRIRQWYKDKGVVGKYPKNFTTGFDLE
jgi:1-acyl-sn-glycerol-3-phosphate acyltransferase